MSKALYVITYRVEGYDDDDLNINFVAVDTEKGLTEQKASRLAQRWAHQELDFDDEPTEYQILDLDYWRLDSVLGINGKTYYDISLTKH